MGHTYTLQVDVGFRKDLPDLGTVSLIVGGNTIDAVGVPDQFSGDWATYTAVYTALAADAGAPITISLFSGSEQGDFDNVRLSDTGDSTPTPEPTTLALLGAALVGFGALRRRS